MLLFANPLPSYGQAAQLNLSTTPSVGGVPWLILAYPLYILLCISLSLDALRHPGPSGRVMGDLARRRARPWLVAASVALLVVSLLVAWAMLWIPLQARQHAFSGFPSELALTIGWLDLIIASFISAAILLQGQAIVAYEVFTGITLPRRGLWRQWRNAIILAGGYAAVVGASLTLQLHPIYSLLLSTLLIALFYALFGWRSYAEREHTMAQLRPFISSQRLYDHLVAPSAPPIVDAAGPFHALCKDVLGTRVAYLIAIGPLARLVGAPLVYPENVPTRAPSLAEIIPALSSPEMMCLPLDPARFGGAKWAIPLWSERGLIGALLLGEKREGAVYTQEEMEIARASGERLVDTQASAEMARRLMSLQRQRLVESQVLDRRARRVLHDDVLPQLHTLMLNLSSTPTGSDASTVEVLDLLGDVHRQLSGLLREMPAATSLEVSRLGLFTALRQILDDDLAGAFDGIDWQVEAETEHKARALPALTVEVLFYAAREVIRNAARHGRGADTGRSLHLRVEAIWRDPSTASEHGPSTGWPTSGLPIQTGQPGLEILIEDDGVGLQAYEKGEGDTDQGRGLALHSTLMAVIGGTLAVETLPNAYTRVVLALPCDLAQP